MARDYFGQDTASDVEGTLGSRGGDFIQRFKKGKTRIRFIPYLRKNASGDQVRDSMAWETQREHFDARISKGKFFPCIGSWDSTNSLIDDNGCIGCRNLGESPKRRYYFNAIDEEGHTHIYGVGVDLRGLLRDEDVEQGTLSDRDYLINRVGEKMSDTAYYPIPDEKYPVDFTSVPILDVKAALESAYAMAEAAYAELGGMAQPVRNSEPAPARNTGRITPQAAKQPSQATEQSAQTVAQAPQGDNKQASLNGWGPNPTDDQIESADTQVIKSWLDDMEVEYPSRAVRQRLVDLAKKTSANTPPF